MKIELRRVSKHFGSITALDDVSLEIPAGRALALVGPNGSGKSTLIRVLLGLVRPEGELSFDGRPRSPESAREIVYVPQLAPRIAAPVGELVRTVAGVRGLAPVRLRETAALLELDLDQLSRRSFQDLSGGTKQKLLLALALASPASVYVLDEPTASLDARARQRVVRMLSRRAPETTLVLCSHRSTEIDDLVSHVVALAEGRIVYDGPAAPYLSALPNATIELNLASSKLEPWLIEQGFWRRPDGSWQRSVSRRDKLALLESLTRLDGDLENIQIRDLDPAEPERSVDA
jgi:ABC-2 type transport system ATP-binding protein